MLDYYSTKLPINDDVLLALAVGVDKKILILYTLKKAQKELRCFTIFLLSHAVGQYRQ